METPGAAETVHRLCDAIDRHDWDTLPRLLGPDFRCTYLHTGEVLDATAWVRLNAEYPGFERLVVAELVADGSRAAARCDVTSTRDGAQVRHAVAMFAATEGGLVTDLTEVWAETGTEVPEHRPA